MADPVYEKTEEAKVATTRRQGESKEEQRMRARGMTQVPTQEMMAQAFQQQQELMRMAQQGQVNPITGTRSIARRTVGGDLVDPNAPTGLAWLEAFGPQRESAQQRQANLDAQLMTPDDIAAGRSAVADLKAAQAASGARTAFDDSSPVDIRGQVMQTPGSDVRVAYDQNGMPVGFSGVAGGEADPFGPPNPKDPNDPTKPLSTSIPFQNRYSLKTRRPQEFDVALPTVGGTAGGFSAAESAALRDRATSLAANQSVARMSDAFGTPSVEVGPLEPINTTSPVDSLGNANPNYRPPATPNIFDRAFDRTTRAAMNITPTWLQDYFRNLGFGNTFRSGEQAAAAKKATATPPKTPNLDEFGYPVR